MGRLRYLTAGESHGPAVVAVLEGLPAGIPVRLDAIERELARRRMGHGRSPRMAIEDDPFELLAGVRHGRTLGSPVAIVIANSEWPKWQNAMSATPVDDVADTARAAPLTRPRPGHADLAAALKYGYTDVRDGLERASARETAGRVAIGALAKALLREVGMSVLSHVTAIGGVVAPPTEPPEPDDLERIDASPVRCLDGSTAARMVAAIDAAVEQRTSVGGVIEVVVRGAPVGLGSHVQWDRKLDARLAAAVLSVQAMKGVEVGAGFALGAVAGHDAHDEIERVDGALRRATTRAGGIEAGISYGEPIVLRAVMKPLSSLMRPLRTVDLATGEAAEAITQRSDVCAVPRAGVVLEAVVALVVADALLEKTGGDSLEEVRRNLDAYAAEVAHR